LLGKQPSESVYQLMAKAQFLIVPSEWYEPFGLTVIEALSVGTPIVASKIGALSEIVVDGLTGLHFESGNDADLAEKIQWAIANPEALLSMGEAAYIAYQTSYTPSVNYHQLIQIYESVINRTKLLSVSESSMN